MKILSVGDSPLFSSGYGCVWQNLLDRWVKLKPEWTFYHMSWQNYHRPHQAKEGYWVLPTEASTAYGFKNVLPHILTYQPDLLVTLADVGVQAGFIDAVTQARQKGWQGKWLCYVPVDCVSWEPLLWSKILEMPDMIISMADWGKKVFDENKIKNVCIKHGCDIVTYQPKKDRDTDRAKYNLTGNFVVGYVGRNQTRKNLAGLLMGFARFSRGKKDVRLLLHTEKDSPNGWSIPGLIKKVEQYDPEIVGKVLMTKENMTPEQRQYIQPDNLNNIYNLFDVVCHCGNEGFGLPSLECQCAGTPLAMLEDTTGDELTGTHGFKIKGLRDIHGDRVTVVGANGVDNTIPDTYSVAEQLEKAYNEFKEGKWEERRKLAREFALGYDWDLKAKEWIDLFNQYEI